MTTTMLRRRPRVLAALAAALVVAGLSAVLVDRAGADEDRCVAFSQGARDRWTLAADDAARAGEGALRTLVIGDSYSVGLGVEPGQSWPTRLDGAVLVDGFSGSGFSREASGCGELSYATRAPRALARAGDVDLVVVEGGLNDFDQPEADLRNGVRRLLEELGDRPVLVVGPVPAPARAAQVPGVDAVLAELSAAHGASYLSMAEADLPYLPDLLHLTPEGHAEFGDLVADAVADLATVPRG
ncbi:SGNH/GDSL hydrolase family protein [Nocardioides sambongensis]|uniref:SGNH/GDSL hydrolase family protein n=1 Tax=Nocardioides sambongensis TaxID=2589074 RepID=UPI0015E84514|nr:SGNH/GDSL hydrolase family protein [Nocardioides sambongensis]